MKTLNEDFVNVWLLAKDLEAIAEGSDDEEIRELCELIKTNYDYPVDSVLIAPDLQVVGHVNVHEPGATDSPSYLSFLRKGLAKTRGEAVAAAAAPATTEGHGEEESGTTPLVLSPDEPTATLLDVIRRRGFGEPSMRFFPIDLLAFHCGGELEITVRVGGGEASGRFELCATAPDRPDAMSPVKTLTKVAPGGTDKIVYQFESGAMFGLATMPAAGTAEGEVSAFLVTLTVRKR